MMPKTSVYWIIGIVVFFSGVFLVDNVTVAPAVARTTLQAHSAYIIGIRIINRIYNDSLKDPHSIEYMILRQDVEKLFFDTYSSTPSLEFIGITEMTFSNGSVIASSTALFGSEQTNEQIVKAFFVDNYTQHPSAKLDLNISYTQDREPIPATLPLGITIPEPNTTHSNSSFTTNSTATHTPTTATHTFTNATTTTSSNTTHTLSITAHTSTNTTTTTNATHTSHTRRSVTDPMSHTSRDTTRDTSTFAVTGRTTSLTSHLSSNGSSHIRDDRNHTDIIHLRNVTSPSLNDSTAHNDTVSPSVGNNTTIYPSNFTSAMPASNHSSRPEGSSTTRPSHANPDSSAAGTGTEQGVPGWGIALLVLAAIIIFLILLLFIVLLLCWNCWWRRRGFLNVSDPDPPGYYNPEIPMYATQSTYDSRNSKSPDSDSEGPPKNRTGMYVVNK